MTISQQAPSNSRKSQQQNRLSFPILSDHGGQIAAAFGIRFRLPDDLINVYKGFGIDLPVINGEPSWTLPMPARYVIAPTGVIAYAEVNSDYTRRPDPSDSCRRSNACGEPVALKASYSRATKAPE